MNTEYLTTIVVGPEDPDRLQAIAAGLASRLDYRLVAEHCQARIGQWWPSSSSLRGPRLVRLGCSFFGNLRDALRLTHSLTPGSVVYSTGETWGLPIALTGAILSRQRFTHIVYVHRIFSPAWLRFLHSARHLLAVDGWICVTHHQARLLRAALGPDGAPVRVVPQGVDTLFFDPAKANRPTARPYILSVGVEMRNYDLFFEAVRDVNADVIVKVSSAWMAAGRRNVTSAPHNVRLITERLSYSELRDLYAGAAVVMLSVYDTPQAAGITTIFEGMAMGRPLIATKSRGLPDGLVNDENCAVADPTREHLAAALASLLNDPARAEGLARNGQRFAREQVSLEQHASQVADFIRTIAYRKFMAAERAR